MRTLKNDKKIKIILLTLLVIAVTVIFVGINAKNIMAAVTTLKCPSCNTSDYMVYSSCTSTKHTYKCYRCGNTASGNHKDGSHGNGGKCTECNQKYQDHTTEITGYRKLGGGQNAHVAKYSCTYSGCTYTTEGGTQQCSGGTHGNGGICTTCKEQYQNHSQTTSVVDWVSKGTTHLTLYACSYAGCTSTFSESEPHSGGTHPEGKCQFCKQTYQTHTMNKTGGRSVGVGAHVAVYTCSVSGCGKTEERGTEACSGGTHPEGKCSVCQEVYQEHKTILGWVKTGNKTNHTQATICSCGDIKKGYLTQEHTGGEKHDSGGKCSECDEVYVEHNMVKTTSGKQLGGGIHLTEYICIPKAMDGFSRVYCNEKETRETEPCYGGTHNNGGICSYCGYQYQNHGKTETKYVKIGNKTHLKQEVCSYPGCSEVVSSTTEPCTGISHESDGKCTKCDYQYETYHKTVKTGKGRSLGNRAHVVLYKCESDKCSYTTDGERIQCSGGTHDNGGKCSACDYKYQTHTPTNTLKGYTKTQTTHTPIYACAEAGCTSTYPGTASSHTGGSHKNGGVCTTCTYQYQIHGQSSTLLRYETTSTTHTPVYACTQAGCSEPCKAASSAHTGGSHANGGKCTVCNVQYQSHGKSSKIVKYEITEKGHTPVYACNVSGCTETYNGTEVKHTGATHANDGKCTVCEKQYQTHSQSTTISKYKTTGENHTPVYKCTHEGCLSVYDGETKNHTVGSYTDNKNGTHSTTCTTCNYKVTQEHNYENKKCTHCNAQEPVAECEHCYTRKNDDTKHWEECIKCNQVKEGTLKDHIYNTYTDNSNGKHTAVCATCSYRFEEEHSYKNGICEKCSAIEPVQKCEHSYKVKNDETKHWEQCEKCEEIKESTQENHKFTTYTDNKNGTHSSTCTTCNYKIIKDHNYENGKCINCNAQEPEKECEHSYARKSNSTKHWEECIKCNQVKLDTLEEHKYTKYEDNENGTHNKVCSVCNYKVKEEHNYENEKCTNCNAEKPAENCEHEYVEKTDKEGHYEECTKCEQIKEGSLKTHKFVKYIDNKDGTHTSICLDCSYKITEEHKADGTCEDCNKEDINPDDGNNDSNNNQDNNDKGDKNEIKDNTVADGKIPQTGVTSIIMVSILSLGIISAVAILKVKQYRDI